jgi:hypothetical protein
MTVRTGGEEASREPVRRAEQVRTELANRRPKIHTIVDVACPNPAFGAVSKVAHFVPCYRPEFAR